MGTKEEFLNAAIESIVYLQHMNKERKDNPQRYYDDKYAEPIKRYFKERNVISYEVNRNNRWHCTPICSLLSSGRLCFLDFITRDKNNVKFEEPIENDLQNSQPTKMDAVIGNNYYECKCQEIVSKSHGGLRETYLKSKLFNDFGIKNYSLVNEESKDEDCKKREYKVLAFNVSELNIQIKKNPDYRKLHFDLKQLICHLIAIAQKNKKNPVSLNYVFYIPSKSNQINEEYKNVIKLYKELNEEIKAIWKKDTVIQKFCDENKITLNYPQMVPIGAINDFNYLEAFKK